MSARQDGGRALRAAPRRREGTRRADGSDRDARGAALPHGRGALPRAGEDGRPADQLGGEAGTGPAAGSSILVGTHALIQEGVDLGRLAVAGVDEQHRFGAEQRAALAEGRSPHVLHMTATPIPRTPRLTVYGATCRSARSRSRPPRARPIVTSWIEERRASEAYTRLTRSCVREGRRTSSVR